MTNNSLYIQVEETSVFSAFLIWIYAGKKIDSFVILKVNYGRYNKAIISVGGCERESIFE
ncbi:hypothetical protein G9G63_20990 [Paenibacillus sp. EKM202P]|uniref:hypothetical protein n=1 Tax=unclassified Paenibacillus TaxID=185978 RepID=UPI0013EDCAF0|nr:MULTISPECIES: hypothetical protein [unclassified Paenibacillus]KAF6561228.1 hypothetical protein G9G63_20990 [Paenibacillus sp. EKM202P]KAF6566136.1 hypothetical protein G9G64_20130 [Paenibacillus sp. EKM207P]MCV9952158.1 hypothetical protein [Paenibacillus sp. BT-177]